LGRVTNLLDSYIELSLLLDEKANDKRQTVLNELINMPADHKPQFLYKNM